MYAAPVDRAGLEIDVDSDTEAMENTAGTLPKEATFDNPEYPYITGGTTSDDLALLASMPMLHDED